jgi:hypothetical protein
VLGAFAHARAQLLHARGQPVAHALEPAQIEQHRPLHDAAGARRRCGDVWEALGNDRAALAFQARDLRPQRRPCGALVDRGSTFCGATPGPRAGAVAPVVPLGVLRPLSLRFPTDGFLRVIGHTRLLAGRS